MIKKCTSTFVFKRDTFKSYCLREMNQESRFSISDSNRQVLNSTRKLTFVCEKMCETNKMMSSIKLPNFHLYILYISIVFFI